jgi:hypothetical protein
MTTEHEASRTLVKSPPELWAECSEAASLARHLDQFGEIRITKLEPETAVAWEGEEISGTVRFEPSGWGTRVTMTARSESQEPPEPGPDPVAEEGEPATPEPEPVAPEPVPVAERPEPEPEPGPSPAPAQEPPRLGVWARFARMLRGTPAPKSKPIELEPAATPVQAAPPEPECEQPVEPAPPAEADPPSTVIALTAALESLGQAHHRPYSRA